MKVSVVMTTYNGEKYIYEQMKSIYEQTQLPDEVIICDDCSSDDTVCVITGFIKKFNLNNWKLLINEENKGWQRNFIEAMEMATGDIIFLSDQDDIWMNDKIEYMISAMKNREKIKCLAGNIITIDNYGESIYDKHGYSAGNMTNKVTNIPFTEKFNTITILGCSMCITREVVEVIKDIGFKNYSHDAQACRLANLLEGMYIIDRPVIKYRIHNNNTSGVSSGIGFGSTSLDKRINTIKLNIEWLEAVLKYYQSNNKLSNQKLSVISKTKEMQENRYAFLVSKSLVQFGGLIKYKDYYSNISMLLGDFAYCYGINRLSGKFFWNFKRILKLLKDK